MSTSQPGQVDPIMVKGCFRRVDIWWVKYAYWFVEGGVVVKKLLVVCHNEMFTLSLLGDVPCTFSGCCWVDVAPASVCHS